MRLLIDIGHPGHVHYFRNLYFNLIKRGHIVQIIARDKDVSFELLRYYKIPFISRGSGGKSSLSKLIYLVRTSWQILRISRTFKPDLMLSFASPYLSLASLFQGCPGIVLDDTEVGRFERLIYKPAATWILTPKAFLKDLGKKHICFDGFMELAYLLPQYFNKNNGFKNSIEINCKSPYILIRFVSWEASHDRGQKGLSLEEKNQIINHCKKFADVYISSEGKLPESFERYRLKIRPNDFHQILSRALIYIGEGATTASEAFVLGVPSIYINSISAGTIEQQVSYGTLFSFRNFEGVLNKISEVV
jgi:predicted glycosyltransferase